MRVGPACPTKGTRESKRVSGSDSHAKRPLTPATRDDTGSRPSGGRVNVVRCDCEMAVSAISPLSIGNEEARPKIVVGADAKSWFSSYCTVTRRGVGNRLSGRVKRTWPSS